MEKNKKECIKECRFASMIKLEEKGWNRDYKKISSSLNSIKARLNTFCCIMDTMDAFKYSSHNAAILRYELPRFLANLERTEKELKELCCKILAFTRKN